MSELQNQIDELRKKLESIPLPNDVKLAFKDNMDKALELIKKLDSKMEKKEDSEALKAIKKLAKEESEFYDKHGYFSYWSDELKAKRIKELKEKKDSAEICEKHPQKKKCVFINTEHCKICGYWNKEASGGEKEDEISSVADQISAQDVSKEIDLLNSKPPEPNVEWIEGTTGAKEVYKKPKCNCAVCQSIEETKKILNEPREDDSELYELYLQDNNQYYFKKTTHPFTEFNNMVNLGIGEIVVNRSDRQELILEFEKIGERLVNQIKARYGKTSKGSEFLENLFKEEFKKWEERLPDATGREEKAK